MHRNRSWQFCWFFIWLLALPVLGDEGHTPLRVGAAFPPFVGQTLSGKRLELPETARGEVTVAIFSFSRAGGRDARSWGERLATDFPHLLVYNVIFLESVPPLIRSLVASGIRTAMPSSTHDRTLLLYREQAEWERTLHVSNGNKVCVIALGKTGLVRWIFSGPFTETVYAQLREQLGTL